MYMGLKGLAVMDESLPPEHIRSSGLIQGVAAQ